MTLWILGAPDPEMAAIERLLRDDGRRVAYAVGPDGHRVHPGNAYQAAGATPDGATLAELLDQGERIALVECGGPSIDPDCWVRIDHHRPGDPGYGRPPAEYWPASSLGQVARMILTPAPSVRDAPTELLLVAAADHCLGAAYQGECPGVDPEALMAWRVHERAAFQRRPEAAVLADVQHAMAVLQAAPRLAGPLGGVADLGAGSVPEAPEAAARLGQPFQAIVADRDGRTKCVVQVAPPDIVAAWLAEHRAAGHETYGDPTRGFAGAYL